MSLLASVGSAFTGGVSSIAAGVGSAVGSILNPVISYINTKNTNKTNKEIAEKNADVVRETNSQNQEQWQQNFDYQKALQQQLFEREDSAYQRTINDMRAAGLSPLMMSGTNNAGEAIATSPYQASPATVDYQAQPMNSFDFGNPLVEGVAVAKSMKELSYDDERIKSVKLANQRAELENKFLSEDYVNRIATSIANRILAENKSSDSSRSESFNKYYNISNDMPDSVKAERIARQVAKDLAPEISSIPSNRDDELEALRASASKLPIIGGLFKKASSVNEKIVNDEVKKAKKASSSHGGKGRVR